MNRLAYGIPVDTNITSDTDSGNMSWWQEQDYRLVLPIIPNPHSDAVISETLHSHLPEESLREYEITWGVLAYDTNAAV